MSTFARIIDGYAIDVVVTPPSLEDRFHPEWLARQTFVVVPDGTVHGAIDNGDGTFTNPPQPVIPTVPMMLSKTAFQDLAWSQLAGGGATGMARFNVILKACQNGTDVLQAIYDRYQAADTFAYDQVKKLTDIMVAATIMTAGEQTSIVSNWPQQPQG